jgi:hypothetical protein
VCAAAARSPDKYVELNKELDLLHTLFDHIAMLPMRGVGISRAMARLLKSTAGVHVDAPTTLSEHDMIAIKLPKIIAAFKAAGQEYKPGDFVFCARCLATEHDPDGNINYLASSDAAGDGWVLETQVGGPPRCVAACPPSLACARAPPSLYRPRAGGSRTAGGARGLRALQALGGGH